MAERLADESLSVREALLADLARAAARPGGAGSGEIERLRDDLRTDAVSRRWLEAVAPAVLAAFGRLASADESAEGEREAEAEAEAEAALAPEATSPRRLATT